MNKINNSIFLVGHARAGSTALAAAINSSEDVGPKYPPICFGDSLQKNLNSLLDNQNHFKYSDQLEQKEVWFKYCGGEDVFTHMGKELLLSKEVIDNIDKSRLIEELTWALKEKVYFSKAPTNSFRLNLIEEIAEKPKIVAIVRDGREVAASWGRRWYGFGKRVKWGEVNTLRFSERKAIDVFVRKWEEVIHAIDHMRTEMNILVVDYNDLLSNWKKNLCLIFDFLGLQVSPDLLDCKVANNKSWEDEISTKHHKHITNLTIDGNAWIKTVKNSISN